MSDSESTMSRTQLHNGIREIYSRVHKIMGLRRRKEEKARVEIVSCSLWQGQHWLPLHPPSMPRRAVH